MYRCIGPIFLLALVVVQSGPVTGAEMLTWDDCVREAKGQHPDLVAAEEAVQAARAKRVISASEYRPQLSSDLGRSRSKSSSETDKYSYGVSGSQLLFDGFKTRAEVRGAEAELRSEESAYREASAEVRYALRSAFTELLRTQELLGLTEEIARRRKQNAELVKLRYEAGREHKGSLLRSEAVVAQANFEIEQAKRALRVAQRRLIKELGRKRFEPIEAKGILEIEIVKDKTPSLKDICQNHPTTRRLEATTAARETDVSSRRSSFIPEISATASYGQSAEDWPPDEEEWTLGIGLSFPIFEGGSRLAELSQAKANLAKARAEERSGADALILTLEDAWAERVDALEWVKVQGKFLEAGRERAKIASAQYSTGLISFEDWDSIEDDLVAAKKALLNAQRDAVVAEAEWIQAKGEGF